MPTNIIHFHAESWDGRMLGMLGHPALRHATPNIDRLAAEGTQFERAYCTHPICCPSRANMWSGRYTHNCESWNNNKGLETGMWCLLDHLPRSHTLKTLGMFGVDRDRDGTITWTTPSGHRYRAVPEPVHRASIIAKALAYEPKETASEPPDPDLDRYFDTAVALGIIDPADFDDVPDPEVDAP